MVIYREAGKIAYYDGYRFVRDDHTGYYLSSQAIGNRRKRLHVYMWEKFNGPVPDGYQVHHKDFDKSKNEISDLQLLTKSEHLSLHAHNMTKERAVKFHTAGIGAAKEWHKSLEGHRWHKKHYEETRSKLYVERVFICEQCGKSFKSIQSESRFCSNKCKSAWRRKVGIDNETRICAYCGKPFTANKYSKTKCCSMSCSNRLHPRLPQLRKNQEHSVRGAA